MPIVFCKHATMMTNTMNQMFASMTRFNVFMKQESVTSAIYGACVGLGVISWMCYRLPVINYEQFGIGLRNDKLTRFFTSECVLAIMLTAGRMAGSAIKSICKDEMLLYVLPAFLAIYAKSEYDTIAAAKQAQDETDRFNNLMTEWAKRPNSGITVVRKQDPDVNTEVDLNVPPPPPILDEVVTDSSCGKLDWLNV